jgi:hypothetical protein
MEILSLQRISTENQTGLPDTNITKNYFIQGNKSIMDLKMMLSLCVAV